MQEKSEASEAFKSFKARIEKEVGNSKKSHCSVHEGEYNSQKFTNFFEVQGIKRQLTATYSP